MTRAWGGREGGRYRGSPVGLTGEVVDMLMMVMMMVAMVMTEEPVLSGIPQCGWAGR